MTGKEEEIIYEILASDENWDTFRTAKGPWGDKEHWKIFRHQP